MCKLRREQIPYRDSRSEDSYDNLSTSQAFLTVDGGHLDHDSLDLDILSMSFNPSTNNDDINNTAFY